MVKESLTPTVGERQNVKSTGNHPIQRPETGGNATSGSKLTIILTDDQQKQIKDATGRSIRELNIDLAATGNLTEKELEEVAGRGSEFYKMTML
jgi:hypothetical protein